ncbi:hypothetical protein YPPY11_0178, partial [Yersinia pestis PY-11]
MLEGHLIVTRRNLQKSLFPLRYLRGVKPFFTAV